MKKIYVITAFILAGLSGYFANAQQVSVTPFYGYQYGGKFKVNQGDLKVIGSDNYGGIIDVLVAPDYAAEFIYSRQDTKLQLKERATGIKTDLFDMAVEYFQLGVKRSMTFDNIEPFSTFTLGATGFHPKDNAYDDEWLFSFAVGLGTKIFFSEKVGLRLQARMLVPVEWVGGSIFCGTGGCSTGLSSGSTALQGDVFAGLVIVLN